VDAQTYYSLTGDKPGEQMNYTFLDGYMIVGPTRAIVAQAVHIHASGVTLATSTAFHDLLPVDSHADVSALLYQNLQPVLGQLAGVLNSGQLQSLKTIAAGTKPTVICAYGGADSIEVASAARFPDLNSLTFKALLGARNKGTGEAINP
ncbi:MAG TPA: hypothetical protein VFU76_15065, partial [Terriglobales bacterium]|nr:hypothetical protein [Terriglobales bacterium]